MLVDCSNERPFVLWFLETRDAESAKHRACILWQSGSERRAKWRRGASDCYIYDYRRGWPDV